MVRQLRRAQKAYLMRSQGAVIGLLIAAIFVGSIDVAMRACSAIGTQPETEKVVFVKIQDRLIAVVADSQVAIQTSTSPGAVKPQTSDPSAPNPGTDDSGVFSASNIHPTDGFVTGPATRPAFRRIGLALSSTPASQSRTAAEPHLVSVPMRKPKKPLAKEAQSSTADLEAKAEGQEERGPKPLAFGSIGYNYNPQQ